MVRTKELLLFATLGTSALVVEEQIYQQLIVPRLPELSRVPLSCWLGEYVAPFLVFLAAGWFGASISRTAVLCAAAFVPWLLLFSLYAWLSDVPVGHDIWVDDLAFWVGMSIQFAFWLLVAYRAAFSRWALSRFGRRLTSGCT